MRNSGLYTSRSSTGVAVMVRSVQWGLVLLAVASLCPVAHAGSYLRSGGEVSYSTSLGYSWATQQWDEQSHLQPSDCRREHINNSHYLEYGYSYYYTLFGGASLAQASCAGDTTTGLGDVRLGVRGRTDLYANHRAWELVAIVPTNRGSTSPRLGCGAFGLTGALARKDDLVPGLALSSGIGLELWESPLVHQFDAEASLSGPLRLGSGRLRWSLDLDGRMPLDEGAVAVNSDISDCGTRGKLVKAGLTVGASLSRKVYVNCGFDSALWGDDATLRQGFSCGYTRHWE
jgi:hypothetical protein